jgi:hypothetical protein
LRQRLKWTLSHQETTTTSSWRPSNLLKRNSEAEFLLKSDPKLGGVLLYNTNTKEDSDVGFFIFVILSECDLFFTLPSSSKHGKPNNTNQFNIIFKPKTKSTTNHDYLSINKAGTSKAISMESRSDFLNWFSALRLAKYGEFLHNSYTKLASSSQNVGIVTKSFKSKVQDDAGPISKSKGLGALLKLKPKHRVHSLSWSESTSSISQFNSSTSQSSTWSMLSSESSGSSSVKSTASALQIIKPAKVVNTKFFDDPNDDDDDDEDDEVPEEPIFVPIETLSPIEVPELSEVQLPNQL